MAILMFCSISVYETQITIELSTLTVFCGFRHPGGICIICISKWVVICRVSDTSCPYIALGTRAQFRFGFAAVGASDRVVHERNISPGCSSRASLLTLMGK